MLQRQNSVAATKFSIKFACSHDEICCCDVLLRRVAAICRLVCSGLNNIDNTCIAYIYIHNYPKYVSICVTMRINWAFLGAKAFPCFSTVYTTKRQHKTVRLLVTQPYSNVFNMLQKAIARVTCLFFYIYIILFFIAPMNGTLTTLYIAYDFIV